MPFAFNKELWEAGRKIEDDALPKLNKYFKTNFLRNENDIFDVFDFLDEDNKVIVEIKGRRIPSTQYKETIITASKVTNGFMKIDEGYRVYFVFVFTDKVMEIELKEDAEFQCKFTGTNSIKHYLIPIDSLTEIVEEDDSDEELAE